MGEIEMEMQVGELLMRDGVVTGEALAAALGCQSRGDRRPLGEILLETNAVSRPSLTRVLAQQRGVSLDEEAGYGSGLRRLIESRHLEKTGMARPEAVSMSSRNSVDGEPQNWDRRAFQRRSRLDERRSGDRRR
jgi:hypothetical protein